MRTLVVLRMRGQSSRAIHHAETLDTATMASGDCRCKVRPGTSTRPSRQPHDRRKPPRGRAIWLCVVRPRFIDWRSRDSEPGYTVSLNDCVPNSRPGNTAHRSLRDILYRHSCVGGAQARSTTTQALAADASRTWSVRMLACVCAPPTPSHCLHNRLQQWT